MTFNALIAGDADRSLDPGVPRPTVLVCRHGHSERLDTGAEPPAPATVRHQQRCAVCGIEIPRQRGAAPRKSCGLEHKRFIETQRARAQAAHNRLYRPYRTDTPFIPFRFVVEAQPWYRGAATAFRPLAPRVERLIPTGPLFPEIPRAWLEGFQRLYPALEGPPPVLRAIFPGLEEPDDAPALRFPSRRGRRQRAALAVVEP